MATPRFRSNIAQVHLATIAKKHGISVRWKNGRNWLTDAQSYHAAWQVTIPHPHNWRQYLVALHEFGHLLGSIDPRERALLNATEGEWGLLWEMSAWTWAMLNIHAELYETVPAKGFDRLIAETLGEHLWEFSILASGQGKPT